MSHRPVNTSLNSARRLHIGEAHTSVPDSEVLWVSPANITSTDRGLDPISGVGWTFVFPDPDHGPSLRRQLLIRLAVPLDVPTELSLPPLAVGPRLSLVFWAPMPEAAVHEYDESLGRESHIGATAQEAWKREVHPEPESPSVEESTEGQLGSRVTTPLARHAARTRRIQDEWR